MEKPTPLEVAISSWKRTSSSQSNDNSFPSGKDQVTTDNTTDAHPSTPPKHSEDNSTADTQPTHSTASVVHKGYEPQQPVTDENTTLGPQEDIEMKPATERGRRGALRNNNSKPKAKRITWQADSNLERDEVYVYNIYDNTTRPYIANNNSGNSAWEKTPHKQQHPPPSTTKEEDAINIERQMELAEWLQRKQRTKTPPLQRGNNQQP